MIKFIEFLSFQLLLWSPILLAALLYASVSSLKSYRCSLDSFWSSLIISAFGAIIIMIGHKLSLGWIFPILEYYLALSLFTEWVLILFLIIWPLHLFARTKPAALKNIVFMCFTFGLICLSIEIANKTYVVASKKAANFSWDKFFNNNEVNKPPQNTYLNLTKPELESIRWHLNKSNDVTTEQLKILMGIFKGSDDSILHLIAENPNIDREIAETLLKKPFRKGFTYYVGDRIARNRNTPPDILVRLLELPDDDIKAAVARNESTPRNILIEMNRPDADKTIQKLKESDYAHKLVKEIKNDLSKNRFDNAKAKFDLVQKLYIDSPNTLIELGKLSVNLFGTKASNNFYEQAAGSLKVFGGKYRLENCRENAIILILLGKAQEAQQLLSKLNSWYPHDERIRNLMEEFPFLKEDLKKYIVSKP